MVKDNTEKIWLWGYNVLATRLNKCSIGEIISVSVTASQLDKNSRKILIITNDSQIKKN